MRFPLYPCKALIDAIIFFAAAFFLWLFGVSKWLFGGRKVAFAGQKMAFLDVVSDNPLQIIYLAFHHGLTPFAGVSRRLFTSSSMTSGIFGFVTIVFQDLSTASTIPHRGQIRCICVLSNHLARARFASSGVLLSASPSRNILE